MREPSGGKVLVHNMFAPGTSSRSFLRLASLVALALVSPGYNTLAAEVDFLRDVRPILSSHCFKCHGPDEATRKADLRLDIREEALKPAKSGQKAIVPSEVEESELMRRVFASDQDDLMPPPATKHPLDNRQKEILKQWIAQGAGYDPHWAFEKPRRHDLPQLANTSWPRNEIDYFVLSRLEKEGMKPTERADGHKLVRRLYLDLIGLPPTPAQADEFLNDPHPDAYERMVDRLLASPHYGERWARRWLDLARYADTNGYEKDRPRSIWSYRDWVIRALNEDMPFDQFTREQIAGDMLPNPTPDQIIATGFHRNTMLNEEGGIDPLEYRFYSMVDRVHVTATTWLGLTMACAQCHTHKYDPIEHKEYYSFMALLNNADEPKFEVPDAGIAARREEMEERIAKLEKELINKFPAEVHAEWLTPASSDFSSENGAESELLVDGSIRVRGKNPEKDTYTLKLKTSLPRITHLQLEAIPEEDSGPGRTDHGNFVLSEIEVALEGGSSEKIDLTWADADHSQDGFSAANAIDGKKDTGWAVGASKENRPHRRIVLSLAEPLEVGPGATFSIRLVQNYGQRHTLSRFRVSFGNDTRAEGTLAEQGRKHRDGKFREWIDQQLPALIKWQLATPATASSDTPVLTIQDDGSVFAQGDFTKNDTYHLTFRNLPEGVRAFRIEALPDDRLPKNGPGTVSYEGPEGDFWLSTLKASADGRNLKLQNPSQSYASGNNAAAKALDDDLQSGWSIQGGQGQAHSAVFQFAEPLKADVELALDLTFERYYAAGLGRFRIWLTTEEEARASALPAEAYSTLLKYRSPDDLQTLLETSEAARDREILLHAFARVAPELEYARREIDKLRQQMPQFTTTLVMRERPPHAARATHLHHRGEFLQPKQEVKPGIPGFLPQLPENAPPNRLALANWLVSPENPLTARVVMNRHWEAFFGRGLVRTMEDFGFQGELPSHPELLDWLALEFTKRGWSQKEMHKLIVMSATYQQSSRVSPELIERDPENRLLARGPRFRMEAELVRDAALVASGVFSDRLGGPSVFPPQPAGVTTEGAYGALQWKVSEGADRFRRGLYTFAKRTAPFAMTLTFDGPSGEACLARRDRSNTPLQALTLLNDEVFMECARALGQWAAEQPGSEDSILEQMFRRSLTRPPTPKEHSQLRKFYQAQLARFKNGELNAEQITKMKGEDLASQAAWTTVARVLLNLDETITKS